jgi:hypothetical protein
MGAALEAFRLKSSGKMVQASWSISGLKSMWNVLNASSSAKRERFDVVLQACCILTNFLHRPRRQMDPSVLLKEALGLPAMRDNVVDYLVKKTHR